MIGWIISVQRAVVSGAGLDILRYTPSTSDIKN